MKFLNNLYQLINILSLDVVAGAVVGALFFGRLLQVQLSVHVLLTLAFSVWIIYTADHLRDAMTITKTASTDRHQFHQKYFTPIFFTLLLAGLADAIMICFLPAPLLKAGLLLGLIVLVYLGFQRYLKFLKELFVACLYTAGVLLPSIAFCDVPLVQIHCVVVAKYFITALMNLLLFSLFDYREDRHQQQHSFVTWFGPSSTRYGIFLLGMLNIASGFWLWNFDAALALVFIAMNLILLSVLLFAARLAANNYYRIIGDAVFFLPALYVLS